MSWLLLATAVNAEELRVWQDDTGNFRVLAALLERTPEGVNLKKSDGIEVSVPWEKLSPKDQAYVAEKLGVPQASPQFQPAPMGDIDAGREVFATRELEVSDDQGRAILKELGPERIVAIAVGLILAVGGSLVFIVRAFQESVLWGLGVIFIPFLSLIFLFLHWRTAWPSTFASLLGSAMVTLAIVSSPGVLEQLKPLMNQ